MMEEIRSPNSNQSKIQRVLIDLLTLLSFLALSIHQFYIWKLWNFDDAYIVYRIVINILEGHGWVYNVGELHNASTSVLNTVLIVIGSIPLYFGDKEIIPIVAHVLNSLCIFLGASFCYLLFRKRGAPFIGYITGMLLVNLLAGSSSWGLETHLFTFLTLLFLFVCQRSYSPYVLASFLVLARPDGALFGVFLVVKRFFSKKWSFIHIVLGSSLSLLLILPWLLFSLSSFGQLFPDTLSNKVWQGASGLWGTGFVYLKGLYAHLKEVWYLLPLSLAGLFYVIKNKDSFLYLLLFSLIQQLVYSFLNVPAYHWYFISLDVTLLVLSGLGAHVLLSLITGDAKRTYQSLFQCAATLITLSYCSFLIATTSYTPRIDQRDAAYRTAMHALEKEGLKPGALGVLEAGTPGFMSDRVIVDLVGLVSKNPPYVSGAFNDSFYLKAPALLLLQNPIWHFERAVTDDVRFEMLYKKVKEVSHPFRNMQIFERIDGKEEVTEEAVKAYIEAHYPQAQEVSKDILTGYTRDEMLCAIDQINGKMATDADRTLSSSLLKVKGWSAVTNPPTATSNAFLLLQSESKTYKIGAKRHERKDVARVIKLEELPNCGFSADASLLDLPQGRYELFIVEAGQKRFCGPGKFISLP